MVFTTKRRKLNIKRLFEVLDSGKAKSQSAMIKQANRLNSIRQKFGITEHIPRAERIAPNEKDVKVAKAKAQLLMGRKQAAEEKANASKENNDSK